MPVMLEKEVPTSAVTLKAGTVLVARQQNWLWWFGTEKHGVVRAWHTGGPQSPKDASPEDPPKCFWADETMEGTIMWPETGKRKPENVGCGPQDLVGG